jgi:hypothetical protein
VLVEGASMPTATDLPEPLRGLARLQAIELSDSRWGYDIKRLAKVLETAGVHTGAHSRLRRWLAPLAGFVAVLAIAVVAWFWQASSTATDAYIGVWHLPNGSYWTVTDKAGQLWVEETHHDSKQVWKRGPATIDAEGLSAQLHLVFAREPLLYMHRLSLTDDHQSLIGSVRRSDQSAETSLVLTRAAP